MGRRLRRWIGLAVTLSCLAGCAGTGPYVWVQDLPPPPPSPTGRDDDYLINPGDIINIRVFEQDAMSSRVKVRTDGKVALPFAGETQVSGKRPTDLARELESRLKEYIVSPKVTVNVDEFQLMNIAVLGEVSKPGTYPLEHSAGVMQALASAGGMTDYADHDRIFVLRKTPALRRVRFTFDALSQNERRAVTFGLQPGDIVVVE
jgi:polysaccharide export outer membrane protein